MVPHLGHTCWLLTAGALAIVVVVGTSTGIGVFNTQYTHGPTHACTHVDASTNRFVNKYFYLNSSARVPAVLIDAVEREVLAEGNGMAGLLRITVFVASAINTVGTYMIKMSVVIW